MGCPESQEFFEAILLDPVRIRMAEFWREQRCVFQDVSGLKLRAVTCLEIPSEVFD